MTDNAQRGVDFIVSHCANIGAFFGSGDPYGFLLETSDVIRAARPSPVFPDRYIEHVAHALQMVGSNGFLSPPAAVASVYLATRFEFYFRVLSGKLNGDGSWISQSAQQGARAKIPDQRLKKRQVSDVALAYQVMMIGTSRVVPYCAALDSALYVLPTTAGVTFPVANIGDRIAYGRHRVGHGHWGDISAEAVFYGLMTAIIFYAH